MKESRGMLALRYTLNRCAELLSTAMEGGADLGLPYGGDVEQEVYDAIADEIEKVIKRLIIRAGREVTATELIEAFRNCD